MVSDDSGFDSASRVAIRLLCLLGPGLFADDTRERLLAGILANAINFTSINIPATSIGIPLSAAIRTSICVSYFTTGGCVHGKWLIPILASGMAQCLASLKNEF